MPPELRIRFITVKGPDRKVGFGEIFVGMNSVSHYRQIWKRRPSRFSGLCSNPVSFRSIAGNAEELAVDKGGLAS